MRSCWAKPALLRDLPRAEDLSMFFGLALRASREREPNGRSAAIPASHFKTPRLNYIRGAKLTVNPVL
jgi:hypothetical protein